MTLKIGRPRKQFCVNGHDTHEVGRDEYSSCLQCKRDKGRRKYSEEKRKPMTLAEIEADVAAMRQRVADAREGKHQYEPTTRKELRHAGLH